MVVFGLNQGMQPIAGYNFGARQYSRVTSVLKMTIALATVVMSAGFLIAELYPYGVSSLFTRDRELSDIVVPGLRLVMISAPIAGFQMVTSNFFQSIGLAKKAIYLGLTRQIIFLLPCLLILPPLFGVNGVWYSMPAADILSAINAAVLLGMQLRKLNKLKDAETI